MIWDAPMNNAYKVIISVLILLAWSTAIAQTGEDEQLKITALEALIAAPPERALPIARKVLEGSGSNELKSRALFVLSQIDSDEADQLLIDTARNGSDALKAHAVRMIGIGGNESALALLPEIYASGDRNTRDAVLEAYLIADDSEAVYQIAANTEDPKEFDRAVEMLAAMHALDELRRLRSSAGMSRSLVQAYAITGDTDVLLETYQNAESDDIRQAALEGLMIADDDEAVLQLFRQSQDTKEKRRLLEMLVAMDSEAVWDIIDSTLENE